jgi:hypothetical protein
MMVFIIAITGDNTENRMSHDGVKRLLLGDV